MKKFIAVLGIVLLCAGFAQADDDIRMANVLTSRYAINKQIDLFSDGNILFRKNISEFNSTYGRMGLVWHALPYLDTGYSHLMLDSRSITQPNKYAIENRDELFLTPKVQIGNWRISNRILLAYRYWEMATEDGIDSRWQARNLTAVAYPIGKWTPYITEEVFYCFRNQEVCLNWLTFGLDRQITKHITAGVFYQNEQYRKPAAGKEWENNHILGTKVSLAF